MELLTRPMGEFITENDSKQEPFYPLQERRKFPMIINKLEVHNILST